MFDVFTNSTQDTLVSAKPDESEAEVKVGHCDMQVDQKKSSGHPPEKAVQIKECGGDQE